MLQVLILVFAIVLFTILAFKRMGALPMATIVSMVTILLAGMPILETLLGPFMEAAASYVQSFFFVFFLGAVFSALYETSGAAKSIAHFLSNITKGKHVASLIFIITAILTFGGISGFVVYFVMYPITLQLFQKNNMSRILIPASITAGCWTISMVAPGSPSIQNVIAMKSLGTPATAALIPGIASVIVEFVLIVLWFEYRTKKLERTGRLFEDPTLPSLPESGKNFSVDSNERLPHWGVAFAPILTILFLFNAPLFLKADGCRGGLAVEAAVFFGILLACVLFKPFYKNIQTYIEMFNRGGVNAGNALLNTAIVVGFGGVARNTEGFKIMVDTVLHMNISPLLFVAVAVAICAGMAGSASGGMGVAFSALKDTFLSLGVRPEYIHRIGVIAAGTLDTLPHQGGQITILSITHMNHKNAYWDIFITQLLIPIIVVLAVTIPLSALGL